VRQGRWAGLARSSTGHGTGDGELANRRVTARLSLQPMSQAPRSEWPIIIGGCHRSGTTLVRRILNSHSAIHCGPEVKFFLDFYGPPRGVKDYMNTARALASDDELLEFFGRGFVELHRRTAHRAGKPRWADKAPENVLYWSHWQRLLGDQWLFIHVVRNPLDTIASLREAGFGDDIPAHILGQVIHYLDHTRAGMRFGREHPLRYHPVIYEQLVTSPDETLASLMSFLEEQFEPHQLEFNSQHSEPALEDYKINSTTAIHADSLHRWPERLSARDAAFIWTHTRSLWMRVDPRERFVRPPGEPLQLRYR
jgi:hypothetical protein